MLTALTAQQFYEWKAFYQIEREHMNLNPKDNKPAQTPADMLRLLDG